MGILSICVTYCNCRSMQTENLGGFAFQGRVLISKAANVMRARGADRCHNQLRYVAACLDMVRVSCDDPWLLPGTLVLNNSELSCPYVNPQGVIAPSVLSRTLLPSTAAVSACRELLPLWSEPEGQASVVIESCLVHGVWPGTTCSLGPSHSWTLDLCSAVAAFLECFSEIQVPEHTSFPHVLHLQWVGQWLLLTQPFSHTHKDRGQNAGICLPGLR